MPRFYHRRQILRGLSSAWTLPFLEYFTDESRLLAATPARRILYCYIGNGAQWQPSSFGTNFTLPPALQSLQALKDYVTIISGLRLGPAYDNRGGAHARAAAAFLTGKTPVFPGPSNVARSLDWMLSDQMSKGLKYPNLTLCADPHSESDTGYSATFTNRISWIGGSNPSTAEVDAGNLFNRLFASNMSRSGQNMGVRGKGALDFVMQEATELKKKMGTSDVSRLDDFLQSMREVETRLYTGSVMNTGSGCVIPGAPASRAPYRDNVKSLFEVLQLAMRCGMANVASYVVASETSNQGYGFLGINASHHTVSHDGSPGGRSNLNKIVGWHMEQFAAFCQKLKDTPEGNGNMLDNSLFVFGGGMGDGSQHTHTNVPTLIVGKGGGIPGGRHINAEGKSFCSLQLALAQSCGLQINNFGDSSTPLSLV